MIRAARNNKSRVAPCVLLRMLARTSVRNATSTARPVAVTPNIILPPLNKNLTNTNPFLIPDLPNGSLLFNSSKEEKPPAKEKSNNKEKSKRKIRTREKRLKRRDKDIGETIKDIDSKPTADPNNPVSSSSKVLSSGGGGSNGNNDNNGNDSFHDDNSMGCREIKYRQVP